MNWDRPFTIRRGRMRTAYGYPVWSVYDANGYYTGMGLTQDVIGELASSSGSTTRRPRKRGGKYVLRREGVVQGLFATLKAARTWLNQSELERIVTAIG